MIPSNYGTSLSRAGYAPASSMCLSPYQNHQSASTYPGRMARGQPGEVPSWAQAIDSAGFAASVGGMALMAYSIYRNGRRLVNDGWAGFAQPQGVDDADLDAVAEAPAGTGSGAASVAADGPLPLRAIACQAAAQAARRVEPQALARSLAPWPERMTRQVLEAHEPARAAYKTAHPYQWRLDYMAGLLRRS